MTITDNEIIKGLECCSKSCSEDFVCCACPYAKLPVKYYCGAELSKDCLDFIIRQNAENERLQAFKSYFDELYGKGLEVANWHLNGNTEPFDNFYESALEEMEECENG